MLPDLRIVILAVFSTFIFAVGVGFYTSHRLMNEPNKSRAESLAQREDSPINRIALNWPEPVQQSSQLDLDFAINARASRNPVRDITENPRTSEGTPSAAVREAATGRVNSQDQSAIVETPKPETPKAEISKTETPRPYLPSATVEEKSATTPIESKPSTAAIESKSPSAAETKPMPADNQPAAAEPATQTSTPQTKTVETPAIPQATEAPATTGSIVQTQQPAKPDAAPAVAEPVVAQPSETEKDAPSDKVASRPDSSEEKPEGASEIRSVTAPLAQPKAAKPAAKKATPAAKRVKKAARPAPRRASTNATPTVNNNTFPFSLFQHSFPN